ncbi:REST corepressor-like isoform X1 [Ctenocephalides felis]|uniref:REST corepressor-like isoform X1 n=2 Tax=Ctenocephalides felis TaxID=7515 RepID=UPI000E6E22F0|nr:REST corepressor-like isoform X1 [Ctenocephalides felis]
MVLAERGDLRNGRRSRGPSPNGHGTPDSSSEDENASKRNISSKSAAKGGGTYEAEKIRVGRDYQAVCPEMIKLEDRKPELMADRALLVWSPTDDIPDQKLEEYINVAKDKCGYNGEQALGMLFWHKHDLDRAVQDLANFTPFPDEWTPEDRVLFEQAFQFHGKSFHRIRQMLPDKSIASLVKYYYGWKKSRSRTSLIDRQAKRLHSENMQNSNSNNDRDDNNDDNNGGENDDSDSEDKANNHQETTSSSSSLQQNDDETSGSGSNGYSGNYNSSKCTGCGVSCVHLHVANVGTTIAKLCASCHHYWRRTGKIRPTTASTGGSVKKQNNKKHLPRGMRLDHDDLLRLAREQLFCSNTNGTNESNKNGTNENSTKNGLKENDAVKNAETLLLAPLDREIVSLKIQVQANKQAIGTLKRKINSDTNSSTTTSTSSTSINASGGNGTSANQLIEEIRQCGDATHPSVKITTKWSNEELLLAVQGVRKYGKDFQAIAEAIGSKTEAHVRAFFINYRRRYNLDSVLRDYEQEKNQTQQMDIDNNETGTFSESNSQAPMEASK